jgi:hemerythrin
MSITSLSWSDALALDHPQLDRTHQEFVELLNELGDLLDADSDPLPHYARLLAHTEAHFAMEECWMAATGFAPENCHSRQHAMVLDLMHQVQVHVHAHQDLQPLRRLLPELLAWFPAHAEMMDAALVYQMAQVGYDAATDQMRQPPAPGTPAISTCGSQRCG